MQGELRFVRRHTTWRLPRRFLLSNKKQTNPVMPPSPDHDPNQPTNQQTPMPMTTDPQV